MYASHAAGDVGAPYGLRWLDARAKIVCMLAVVFVAVSTPPEAWQAFVAYGGLLVLFGMVGRVPWFRLGRRLVIVLPFILLVLVFLPFMRPDFSQGEHWVKVLGIRVSSHSLLVIQNVLLKSTTSLCALMLLSATTSFQSLLRGFERLRVPQVFVETVAFAWRYLFVLREEAQRMLRARDARAWRGRWLWQAWTIGLMIGTLFVRSYERAERVYQAMKARGYHGHSHTYFDRPLSRPDWAVMALFAVSLTIIRMWACQTY
jgi:cobalt/nickel transport system permease protein